MGIPENELSLAELIEIRDWHGVSKRIISHPSDILIKNSNGLNPLHLAVQIFHNHPDNEAANHSNDDNFNLRVVGSIPTNFGPQSLLDAAPSHATGSTPLPTLNALLSSPFAPEALLQTSSTCGSTPLHISCRNTTTPDSIILAIARKNHFAISVQDEDGDTPLHLTLRRGASEDVLRNLIELAYRASGLDEGEEEEEVAFAKADDEDGDLPLHAAIRHDASSFTIQLLFDAYPQGTFDLNHQLQTPLLVACIFERYDVVDLILRSDAVVGCAKELLEMVDASGIKPVFCLWERYESEVVGDGALEVLETIASLLIVAASLPSGCNGCKEDQTGKQQQTLPYPFHKAYKLLQASIFLGDDIIPPEFVSFLIQSHPFILRKVDPNGRLPLHNASIQLNNSNPESTCPTDFDSRAYDALRHPEDVKLFPSFASREDPSFSLTKNAVITTAHFHHRTILKVILDAYPTAARRVDNHGRLPFHLAIETSMEWANGLRDIFMATPEALRTKEPNTGLYPFMLAAPKNSLEVIYCLLSNGPDLVSRSVTSHYNVKGETTDQRMIMEPPCDDWKAILRNANKYDSEDFLRPCKRQRHAMI